MNVLVINAGSSSLKYQLMDAQSEKVLAKGLAERIGIDNGLLKHKANGTEVIIKQDMKNHTDAIELVLNALTDKNHGVIKGFDEIVAVGHRVVHGGEKFSDSCIINNETLDAIKQNIDLAPLHNPANIMGIEACMKLMPGVPQVAVFDTAFHQTMPPKAFLYAIPYEAYTKYKVRRYGFHGTSHRYVSGRAAALMGGQRDDLKIITCHLGNGGSIAAVKGGKCVDTSMGLTPLEGIVMGTRSGDLDPAIIKFLMEKENMTIGEMDNYLNKKSGMLGISGVSNDFRDILAASESGNKRAALALEVYCYRIQKYIGAYAAAMGGVDCIVFTAGVGENDQGVRKNVLSNMGWLGVKLDEEKNNQRGGEREITTPDSKVKVFVIPTDEELVIAQDTYKLACK